MQLTALGFDRWFEERQNELVLPGCSAARVAAVNKGAYLVRDEVGDVLAELSGAMSYLAGSAMDLPSVGDWVSAQYTNNRELAIIQAVLPRKSFLRRKTPGRKVDYQLIAANIDLAFIVQACDYDFNLQRLDRYLVMIREGGVSAAVLLTKSDLLTSDEVEQRIVAVKEWAPECQVLGLSNKTRDGVTRVIELLEPAKTYCLLGSSGVGKSTLVNHLLGREQLETNAVSEYRGKGRHTTKRRELVVLENGAMLIDTPGMRELGNIGASTGIDDNFADIEELARNCRFTDCSHTQELGCALLAALASGQLPEERYNNYLKIRRESEHYQKSYAERRKGDREFGRMVKSVLKNHRKY